MCTAARQLKQKHALPCDSLKIAVHKLKCTCSIATFRTTAAASTSGAGAAAKQGAPLLLQHPRRWQGSRNMEIWGRGWLWRLYPSLELNLLCYNKSRRGLPVCVLIPFPPFFNGGSRKIWKSCNKNSTYVSFQKSRLEDKSMDHLLSSPFLPSPCHSKVLLHYCSAGPGRCRTRAKVNQRQFQAFTFRRVPKHLAKNQATLKITR